MMIQKYLFGSIAVLIGVLTNPWILARFVTEDGQISNPFALKVMLILLFNLFMINLGLRIFRGKTKISLSGMLTSLVTIFILLFVMEGALRLFFYVRKKFVPNDREYTELLGWQSSAYQANAYQHPVFGDIEYTSTHFGFRTFGDVNTDKIKVLVVGDSYTQAGQVSDGEAYYHHLQNKTDSVEVFTYGCGGFGSLQEFMIVDTYLDTIQPDLILWQFCANDLINNSHELESQSYLNNNMMTRPYLVNHEVKMLFPKRDKGLLGFLGQHSYVFKIINTRINLFKADSQGSIEDELTNDHPLLIASKNTTIEIFQKLKAKAGDIPVVAFSVDENWEDVFREVCEEVGYTFHQGVAAKVRAAKERGTVVDGTPIDAHWNNNGHEIAGESILDFLHEHQFFQNTPDPELEDAKSEETPVTDELSYKEPK